jgi:hypothetical protein
MAAISGSSRGLHLRLVTLLEQHRDDEASGPSEIPTLCAEAAGYLLVG